MTAYAEQTVPASGSPPTAAGRATRTYPRITKLDFRPGETVIENGKLVVEYYIDVKLGRVADTSEIEL